MIPSRSTDRERVELLTGDHVPVLARPYFENGDPGPIARALAHVPELMEPGLAFIDAVYGGGAVDERLREMVVLRVSSANSCHYCTETHSRTAKKMHFAADEVAALRGEGPPPARWSALERAVFSFSEAISNQPQRAVSELQPLFGEAEIVELVTLAATTVMLNRFATALALPV